MKNSIIRFIVVLTGLAVFVGFSIAETQYEWQDDGAIEVEITSPADDTYITIKSTQSLNATASDPDCERNKPDDGEWSDWYQISDDVTTGANSVNYHMWWTCSGGGEIVEEFSYGTTVTYEAPGYSAGNNVRDITVTAHADDFDRGNETPTNQGYKDSEVTDSITLKVWQVVVTKQQSGTTSGNYDGPTVPEYCGDTDLGWITPASDANSAGYYGNTQIKGSIPAGPGVTTGYSWYNKKKGVKRHKTSTSDPNWVTPYDFNEPNWVADFGPGYPYLDSDSRHPNGAGGTDVREIFAMDSPGFRAGTTNDNLIAAPFNLRSYNFDMDYKAYVRLGGNIISNELLWGVTFTIDANSTTNKWDEVSHTLD